MLLNDIQWLFSITGLRPFSISTRIIQWYSMTFLYNGASPLLNNRYMNNWLCHLCQMLPQFFKRIYRNLFSEELFKESLEFGKYFFYKEVLRKGARFDTSDTKLFYETCILFNDIQWLFFVLNDFSFIKWLNKYYSIYTYSHWYLLVPSTE